MTVLQNKMTYSQPCLCNANVAARARPLDCDMPTKPPPPLLLRESVRFNDAGCIVGSISATLEFPLIRCCFLFAPNRHHIALFTSAPTGLRERFTRCAKLQSELTAHKTQASQASPTLLGHQSVRGSEPSEGRSANDSNFQYCISVCDP